MGTQGGSRETIMSGETGTTGARPPGLAVGRLAETLGGGLVALVVDRTGAEIDDLTVAEPGHDLLGQPGDLVLGIAVADPDEAARLVAEVASRGGAAVLLRRALAEHRTVTDAATRHGLALLALSDQASWAHAVWLLRSMVDQIHGRSGSEDGDTLGDDLFALADGCARLLDAPVTIEDPWSRVMAYSARQGAVDPVRVSTIVGRRVPDEALESLRRRGVFRRLARATDPFFVPADGTLRGRLVIPVRAGATRLGSIWAVVDEPPSEDRLHALTQTASVVALHLLRRRSEADLAGRATADRLREVLTGAATGRTDDDWLPEGPWRVAVLGLDGVAADDGTVPVGVWGLWESALRRESWRRPLLTTVAQHLVAVVVDPDDREVGAPGTWAWLVGLAERLAGDHPVRVAAGRRVATTAGLVRSTREAIRVAGLASAGSGGGSVVNDVDRSWADLVLAAATAGLAEVDELGPLDGLTGDDPATLAAWLDHPGDPRAAAARVHVHPNTLRYRMTRISQRLDVDLGEPRVRDALRLLLRARDL